MALVDDINNLPTTVGDGNTGHLNNHQVIHAGLKSHESRLASHTHTSASITDATSQAGYTSNIYANRVLRLNAEGKLNISTASITAPSDPANKGYVDALVATRLPETLTLRLDTTAGTRIMAGTHMIHGDTGWRDITTSVGNSVVMVPGGKITIRRVGPDVYYKIVGMKATSTYGKAITAPFGFRTAATQVSADMGTDQPATARWQVTQYQVAYVGGTAEKMLALANEEIIIQVVTDNSWPTTLPGTPA